MSRQSVLRRCGAVQDAAVACNDHISDNRQCGRGNVSGDGVDDGSDDGGDGDGDDGGDDDADDCEGEGQGGGDIAGLRFWRKGIGVAYGLVWGWCIGLGGVGLRRML